MRLTLFLFVLAISFDSYAQAPQLPRANQYELSTEASHFSTQSNYGTQDGTSNIPQVGSFTNTRGRLGISYDLSSSLRVFGSGTFAYSESDNGTITNSSSGLSEFDIGGQFWTNITSSIALTPEAIFTYPTFRVDEFSDQTLIGEGAMRLRAGSWALLRTGSFRPFVYLGYEYRDEGRAQLLPYRVGATFQPNQFWAQLEFRGHETVVNDTHTSDRDLRGVYLRQVDGGSLYFYPINPSVREVAAEAGMNLNDFRIKLGFSITVDGNNSADGWTGLVGLSYSPHSQITEDSEQAPRRFDVKSEKYDESLFQDDVSTDQPDKPKRRIIKKIRKKPAVDEMLQDAQKQLEQKK